MSRRCEPVPRAFPIRLDPSSGRPFESIATCLHCMGGMLGHLDEIAAIYLPNANSYRRIVPGAFASFPRAWGLDTRTELHICGGDVNLSLMLAALVAADADGIRNRIDPGAPAQGDLDAQDVERLPLDWGKALDACEASGWVKSPLGEECCRPYALVKRHEFEVSRRRVSTQERARYVEFL